MPGCDVCGREFGSNKGVANHKSQSHNRMEPWHDEATLRQMYVDKRMSTREIADELDCGSKTIKRWLKKTGVGTRSMSESCKARHLKSPPHFRTHDGYEEVCTQIDSKQKVIGIHRLVAISEYGFESVSGKEVHHKNGIPFDNRPENLETLTKAEHAKLHNGRGDLPQLNSADGSPTASYARREYQQLEIAHTEGIITADELAVHREQLLGSDA